MASEEVVNVDSFRGVDPYDTLGLLAEISRRIFSPPSPLPGHYVPPYKIGPQWLKDFLEMPEGERSQTFQFTPDPKLLRLGVEHTVETHLGSIYDQILRQRKREKVRAGTEDRVDISRVGHIRWSVRREMGNIQQNVARLQDEPNWKYELPLLTAEAPTVREARKKLRETASGYQLRWHLVDRVKELRPQVTRAVLLRVLSFPLGVDNMISTQPNFGARIATDKGSKRVMELYWGWGNPHIFYGMDITESEGSDPKFTLKDKVIVASAFELAKGFVFMGSFPQDMTLCIPE